MNIFTIYETLFQKIINFLPIIFEGRLLNVGHSVSDIKLPWTWRLSLLSNQWAAQEAWKIRTLVSWFLLNVSMVCCLAVTYILNLKAAFLFISFFKPSCSRTAIFKNTNGWHILMAVNSHMAEATTKIHVNQMELRYFGKESFCSQAGDLYRHATLPVF